MAKRDYIDFHDRRVPLAYMITIRTYGSWLHGDVRGSMDRKKFNTFEGKKIPYRPGLTESERSLLKSSPVRLDARMREVVECAIKNDCLVRECRLFAINTRSNHIHMVVSADRKAEQMMGSFKSYATRELKHAGLISPQERVWSRHGSTRYLWGDDDIRAAIEYVLYEQGDDLN